MNTRRSRIATGRTLRILDSQTRVRYQNQIEYNKYHRKLIDINEKHADTMGQFSANRHENKMYLYEIRYEMKKRNLLEKSDIRTRQNSISSSDSSNYSDENNMSTSNCSNLLLHNLNSSNEWEKSFILPNIYDNSSDKNQSIQTLDSFRLRYSSKLDIKSSNSFEQTQSFLLTDSLSLKKCTELMKKSIRITVAKSTRDSKILARRDINKY